MVEPDGGSGNPGVVNNLDRFIKTDKLKMAHVIFDFKTELKEALSQAQEVWIAVAMMNEEGKEELQDKVIEEVQIVFNDELREIEEVKFSQDYRTINFNFRNLRAIAYHFTWIRRLTYRCDSYVFDIPGMPPK